MGEIGTGGGIGGVGASQVPQEPKADTTINDALNEVKLINNEIDNFNQIKDDPSVSDNDLKTTKTVISNHITKMQKMFDKADIAPQSMIGINSLASNSRTMSPNDFINQLQPQLENLQRELENS